MPVNVEACPLCGSSGSELFDRRVVQAELVTNRLCKSCGLVYQSPRMSTDELESFYQKEYRKVYQGSEGPNTKDVEVQRGRAAALASFFGEKLTPGTRHLDIGSSAGTLLLGFQERFQTIPVGIEPGIAYREFAQSKGLTVYESLEQLRASQELPFQLVSLAHVLEHIPDPVAYLNSLREDLLAQDGLLLLEAPNLFAHDSFEIAHLFAFSSHTLTQTLWKAGFRVIRSRKHGQPRSQLLPLYITMLARPLTDGALAGESLPKPEVNVPLKRNLGMLRRRVLQKIFPHRAWLPLTSA
ncbi:MAG: methyltransferase domain-containing protein [Anaerolineales bacterium]|jgi:2-polyprenyl-3-methyl-5-hydroxy-6-metoxy-1,4-benzoquinol methylase